VLRGFPLLTKLRGQSYQENGTDEPEGIRAEVMEITPELAADWLARPSENRPINSRKVRAYVAAMERGEWSLNGEAIKRDPHGRLVDGQHRCIAVVESGVTIRSLVVAGVETDAFDSMDSGLPRSASDVLRIHGYDSTAERAAAIRLILIYDWYGDFFHHPERLQPSKAQILAAAKEWPALTVSIRRCAAKYIRLLRFSPSCLAALHFIFTNIDAEDATAFFDRLDGGSGLAPDDPIHVLRQRLLSSAAAKQRLTVTEGAALTIKAWNAFREGRKVRQLSWSPGGARPEAFPTIR